MRFTFLNTAFLFLMPLYVWAQQPKLQKVKIDQQISMDMPETFRPMTDDEVVAEYTVYRRPLAMYRDNFQEVHLGINVAASPWQNSDMAMLKNFYKATILDLYTNTEFIQDDLVAINGDQYVVFEFTSEVVANEKEASIVVTDPIRRYNYIQYTVKNGKVYIFNLSSPIRLSRSWAPTARAMMQSTEVK